MAALGDPRDPRKLTKNIIRDYSKLGEFVDGWRTIERTVAVTIGSWDILHIGHLRYLIEARKLADILIVGVDSDRAIKLYKKSDFRPYVPEEYRCEMLCYQSPVDFVTLVDDVDESGAWQYGLLDVVKPDVFIAVEDSYPEKQRVEIRERCGELVVLPRQAEDLSTTKFIAAAVKGHMLDMASKIEV